MRELFVFLFKTFPAMFSFLEKWINLQEKKLPMKIQEHDEKIQVREKENELDLVRIEDKIDKAEHKAENKAERRDLKDELGPMPNLKKKHQAKKKSNKAAKESRRKNR